MSDDEPLYCCGCGREIGPGGCACSDDTEGPYCELCGAAGAERVCRACTAEFNARDALAAERRAAFPYGEPCDEHGLPGCCCAEVEF
jgi:hypothetical protein